MKVSVKTVELRRALDNAQKVLADEPNKEILKLILLEAFESELVLTAFNEKVCLRQSIGADVKQGGALCVSPNLFDLVKLVLEEVITLKIQEANNALRLLISSGRDNVKMPARSADDYIMLPDGEVAETLLLPVSKHLFEALDSASTSIASATSDFNHSVQLRLDGGELKVVSNNSSNATIAQIPVESDASAVLVIPYEGVKDFKKFFKDSSAITVEIQPAKISLLDERTKLTVLRRQGNPANVEAIFPKEFIYLAEVELLDFTKTCEKAALLATQESTEKLAIHKVNISFSSDELVVSTDSSSFSCAIEVAVLTEQAIVYRFPVETLIRHLKSFKCDRINLALAEPGALIMSPVEFEGEQPGLKVRKATARVMK